MGRMASFPISDERKRAQLVKKYRQQDAQLRHELEELEPLFFYNFDIDFIDYEMLHEL